MSKNTKSILLIDDDNDLRTIMSMKLSASGYDVYEAINGEDGLTKAREYMPDLVLCDVDMPKKNGVETLSDMHADKELSKLKVVFLTNYGDSQGTGIDMKLAKDMGAVGYIKKTDDLSAIMDKVKQFLK